MPKKATKRKAAKASGKKSVSRPAKKKTKIKTTRSTPTTKKKAASKKTPAVKSKKTGASKAYAKPEPMVASRLLRNAPHSIQHKKKPEILASRHKARSAWFRDRAAWPMREASIRTLVHERRRINQTLPEEPGSAQWASVGPTNIGGRMTCIVCDPVNPERVIAGAAGGGLWSSDDAGMTWRSLWHKQDSLNVGTLALDPNNPQIVYCGTGEANLSADSYPGVGVLRSLDGGETWHRLATPECENLPVRIGTIAVDPFDSNHIALGGVGHYYYEHGAQAGGLFVSHNGGQDWIRSSFIAQENYWCHSIVFHPQRPGTIFATFTEEGARNGIWRTDDGGATWTQLTLGLPSSDNFDRTSLVIAPSNPDVLYAIASDTQSGVLGVFRSNDGGDSWSDIHGTHFGNERQMSYNNTIVVHPENEDYIVCGGVDLHLSTDAGQTWHQVTRWNAQRGEPDYAHADHHALLMPAAMPGRIYDMNDGGMDVSDDGGLTWSNRSKGLSATMYYDLDVAQSEPDFFGGGCQDNGTLITVTGQPDDHFDITGGDGGWLVFDPTDEMHIYASIYRMLMFRYREPEGWRDVTPPESDSVRNQLWMVRITMDPTDPRTIFTGSHRVWRTRDDADTWQAMSGNLDGSVITAIEACANDPSRIYVGTTNGGFFRSTDGGDSWSGNLASAVLPGHIITRIRSHPNNADRLLLTVGGFGHSHVYRSEDGGLSWLDVDAGQLANVPYHALAVPHARPDEVYVGGDAGVVMSHDFGNTWTSITRNLPNVSVVDLVYHHGAGTLTAATYGRSLWRLDVEG